VLHLTHIRQHLLHPHLRGNSPITPPATTSSVRSSAITGAPGTTGDCSALDFISCIVSHIPPKGTQIVRYAGLYARNVKRKLADVVALMPDGGFKYASAPFWAE